MKWLLMLGVLGSGVVIAVAGLTAWLGPDDLRACATTPTMEPSCRPVDAIIVVSGGDTNARTDEAVRLFQAGWAPRLVMSGAAQDQRGPSNAAAMRRRAVQAGVPASAIITEEQSQTTADNARLSAAIIRQHRLDRVILVTSGYHQRRASTEFRHHTGGQVVVLSHPVARDKDWSAWWWLTPRGWYLAGSELIKATATLFGWSV